MGSDFGLPQPVLELLGDRMLVLHPLASGEGTGGGDIDCAVSGLDFSWPLRLAAGYRVVQFLKYDVCGWAWVVEHEGAFTIVDAIEDPAGINRLGFATSPLPQGPGGLARPSTRAAYLTAKRIWKGQLDLSKWDVIRELRADEDREFLSRLHRTFGRWIGTRLVSAVRTGDGVERDLWRLARLAQFLRRFDSPSKATSLLYLGPARVVERLLRPTGLFILLLDWRRDDGPLPAAQIARSLRGPLMRERIFRRSGDGIDGPEKLPPGGGVAALWKDLVRAGPAVWKHRVAKGLVIIEGGSWERALKRRGPSSTRSRAMLTRLLPQPDLTAIVIDRPEAGAGLGSALDLECIRDTLGRRRLIAIPSSDDVVRTVQDEALAMLETRVARRTGPGWVSLSAGDRSWIVPRRPRSAVMAALRVHRPPGPDRFWWGVAAAAAATGLFRLTPRSIALPAQIRTMLASHLPPHGSLSVAKTAAPGRFVAAILDASGYARAVAKVALDPLGADGLAMEQGILETLSAVPVDALRVPRVLGCDTGVLLLEPIEWLPPDKPWNVPEPVWSALGELFRRGGTGQAGRGMVHGDCTYGHLRPARGGWVLIDWQGATNDGHPMDDVFNHLLVSHSTFGRPTVKEVLDGLQGDGWVGGALAAYLSGAELTAGDLVSAFRAYLARRGEPCSARAGDTQGRAGLGSDGW